MSRTRLRPTPLIPRGIVVLLLALALAWIDSGCSRHETHAPDQHQAETARPGLTGSAVLSGDAELAGDEETAADYYDQLLRMAAEIPGDRPTLDHAKEFVG